MRYTEKADIFWAVVAIAVIAFVVWVWPSA